MKRFLFVVPPLMGHVNPTLSIGKALLERGHDVAWLSVDAELELIIPTGGKYFDVASYYHLNVDQPEYITYKDRISTKNILGIESVKFLYEEVLIPLNRYMYKAIVFCVDKFKPDVIINDQQLFSAAIVAKQQAIKYASSVTAPAAVKMQQDLPGVSQWEDNQITSLQKELNLNGEQSVACSEQLTLIYTTEAFFGDMILAPGYKFVGLSIADRPTAYSFDWESFYKQPFKRKVLVSIGTTFDHNFKRDFFSKIIAALGNKELTVVVVSEPDLVDFWPSNFIVSKKIPQLDLLPLMDAVICHGGHNTVCETLMHGIPLVVVPIAYDQSYVAGRVVATGCGLRLNYKRFKANQLSDALAQILTQPNFKKAAHQLKGSFEKCGGAALAADLLEAYARNNSDKPVNKITI